MAAEYIVKGGNYQVILCERGIRTFETMTRNTLDLGSIPLIKRLTHLPIIVDPSHGTGDSLSVPADGARGAGGRRRRHHGRRAPRARRRRCATGRSRCAPRSSPSSWTTLRAIGRGAEGASSVKTAARSTTRVGCHLCDVVKEALERVRRPLPVRRSRSSTSIAIRSWQSEYDWDVPVRAASTGRRSPSTASTRRCCCGAWSGA